MSERDRKTPPVVSPEKARQGRWGWPVLIVLVVALILVMIVWWGVEIYGDAITPSGEEQVGDPATVEEPATTPAPATPAAPD